MSKKDFQYYPYRINRYLMIFLFGGGIFCFYVFLGCLIERVYQGAIIMGIMTVSYGILSKVFFDSSKINIYFGDNGLQINNDKRCKYRYIPWESFSYAYWCNYKAHWYLVLSVDVIESKQVKHIIRKRDWSLNMGICYEDAIVICIAWYREEYLTKIKNIIFEKVSHIKEERYKTVK